MQQMNPAAGTTSRNEARPGARASRPHNTGKTLPVSSTRVGRQRCRDSASAGPTRFPPAGWPAATSQGSERHATAVYAGGTPALPGGRLFPSFLLLQWARMRAERPRSRVGASFHHSCSSKGTRLEYRFLDRYRSPFMGSQRVPTSGKPAAGACLEFSGVGC